MKSETTTGFKIPDRPAESPPTTDTMRVLERADRHAHDVAQCSLDEFEAPIDLVPMTDGGRDQDDHNAHARAVAEQLALANDDDLEDAGIDQDEDDDQEDDDDDV